MQINSPPPARRTLKNIGRQKGSRHLILNICDYLGFVQHEGECWVDTIQQIFFFTDGLKELTQPLFYKMTDEELHSKIEEAVRKGIIQDVRLTPTRSTFLPMVGGDPSASTNVMPSAASMAIQNAIDEEDIEKIKTLLDSNKDRYDLDGLLLYIIDHVNELILQSMCQVLLDMGADVNATDKDGNTALILATTRGDEPTVQLLLEKGANVNARDKYNSTALIFAAINEHESIVRLLLEKGADVNARGKDGYTALISAAQYGYKSIIQLLLDKGADMNATSNDGSTALSIAIRKNYLKIIELLTKSTNAPFIASSVTPNIRAPPKADSSLASIIEEGIKAMRDRFINHYNVIVHKKEELCLIKGPQQIKKMYESSIAGPILLKRLESKRLGTSVAAGLQSKNFQQQRLNIGKGYSKDTAGGRLPQELAVNNLLFRTFNLPFRALWLVTALASKAPIHAIGLSMMHITGITLFGAHATGFLKCKDQWYYYNDNEGLFKVSSGFIDALQTALNFNDGQMHPSICIKTFEERCYLLSLNNVNSPYKYKDLIFAKPSVTGPVTPNQIWTESGWVPFEEWKGANASEADKIETTVIITDDDKNPSYYNVLYSAYCIVKYGPEYEDALFRSAIITEDIPYIETITDHIDPNTIVDPVTKMTLLMWIVKHYGNINPLLNNPTVNPNLQDIYGNTALMWGIVYYSVDIQPFLNNPNVNPNLQDKMGLTALMYAIIHQRSKLIIKLIENPRVDLTIKTKGKSVLDFAKETKNPEIIKLVKDAMARPKPLPPSSHTRKRSSRRQKRTRKLRHST